MNNIVAEALEHIRKQRNNIDSHRHSVYPVTRNEHADHQCFTADI